MKLLSAGAVGKNFNQAILQVPLAGKLGALLSAT